MLKEKQWSLGRRIESARRGGCRRIKLFRKMVGLVSLGVTVEPTYKHGEEVSRVTSGGRSFQAEGTAGRLPCAGATGRPLWPGRARDRTVPGHLGLCKPSEGLWVLL